MKWFNTEGVCDPAVNYMAGVHRQAAEIIRLIDQGKYFTINRPRQYGKTNTLHKLSQLLRDRYYVLSTSFEAAGTTEFSAERSFVLFFKGQLARSMRLAGCPADLIALWTAPSEPSFPLLQDRIVQLCTASDRGIVLMIDEADSWLGSAVMMRFLQTLRENYLAAESNGEARFQSVLLAGITDIKRLKFSPEGALGQSSPWDIAADFNVDMSFSVVEIGGMLQEYEADHQTGMDVAAMAALLREYTSGYPVLVTRLCKILDEDVLGSPGFETGARAWTREGFLAAVKVLLEEEGNPLFCDILMQLSDHPDLDNLLRGMLLSGEIIRCDPDDALYQLGKQHGILKRDSNKICIANRIFHARLYHRYRTQEHLNELLAESP